MLERMADLREVRARDDASAEEVLRRRFQRILGDRLVAQAIFVDSARTTVVGIVGGARGAPMLDMMLADRAVHAFLRSLWSQGQSVLLAEARGEKPAIYAGRAGGVPQAVTGTEVALGKIAEVFAAAHGWAGELDPAGRHVLDPRSPSPGPHFATNLLLGSRVDLGRPLQTTPKSVVDQLGHGSFRSHASTQVLAARWDLRPEEHGFPANRQFYLVEDGRQIFYSANPWDKRVDAAETTHAQNHSVIKYRTSCGLSISRTIFLLPAERELPLATEVHSITIENQSAEHRHLRFVGTGMFGPPAASGLWEDVVYTTLCMQARVLQDESGGVVAIGPHYHPKWAQGDQRFHTMIVHQGGGTFFPRELCTSYNEFVGSGTLENPAGLLALSNRLSRKGPAFFALAVELDLPPGGHARVDNFTGLVSDKGDSSFDEGSLLNQVGRLVNRFSREEAVPTALAAQLDFFDHFRRHVQVQSGDADFDTFINYNLPFQILYQTFVSRSFDQTQKGHREIGFREVQDLFASLPFFIAMGRQKLAKELLLEWAGQVHDFGFANHNFFWEGKEPGDFSDDALWLAQAVDRYVNLTGDVAFLDHECAIAGQPKRKRSVYETLRAILRYSGEVSVGKHGLPLLDRADWNDTLRLDPDYLNGPQKEDAYRRQLASGGKEGERLASDNCESVMNAFLLKIAIDITRRFAERRGDAASAAKLAGMSDGLVDRLQRYAWREDFFARVLINRPGRHSYLGAKGDGLSADPAIDGTYFLNSFTWAVLAGVASEAQVRAMLAVLKKTLLTPHGLKLCSPVNFAEITSRGGSAEYFPGDRENGAVFKHADMMAVMAMLEAAKTVGDHNLAAELSDLAYRIVDAVLPYRVLDEPFIRAGNPRFCTQYTNSETGEHVGPTLSGTATWLWLGLNAAFGLGTTPEGIDLNPILRDEQRKLAIAMHTGRAGYHITVDKPEGFFRRKGAAATLTVDGLKVEGGVIPHYDDDAWHTVVLTFAET